MNDGQPHKLFGTLNEHAQGSDWSLAALMRRVLAEDILEALRHTDEDGQFILGHANLHLTHPEWSHDARRPLKLEYTAAASSAFLKQVIETATGALNHFDAARVHGPPETSEDEKIGYQTALIVEAEIDGTLAQLYVQIDALDYTRPVPGEFIWPALLHPNDIKFRASEGIYEPWTKPESQIELESKEDYVQRAQPTLLPNFPSEVLEEWFFRHSGHLQKYAPLDFRTFQFQRKTLPLEEVPGKEAFLDGGFCDSFSDVRRRAEQNDDWLANYMLEEGTWNTPIVLLDTTSEDSPPEIRGEELNSPLHLLEGHRRLSFLQGLRSEGRANAEHEVWMVNRDLDVVPRPIVSR